MLTSRLVSSRLAIHSLQGALGKTSGRSYKAAPRQLLQVDAGAGASPTLSHATANLYIGKSSGHHHEGAAKEAAKLGREALGIAGDVGAFFTRLSPSACIDFFLLRRTTL